MTLQRAVSLHHHETGTSIDYTEACERMVRGDDKKEGILLQQGVDWGLCVSSERPAASSPVH